MKQAGEHGAAAGQNEFAEEAVLARLREIRREKVHASYREAAMDPEYVAEMESVSTSFDRAVGDGLGAE